MNAAKPATDCRRSPGELYADYRAWALARGDYARSTTDFAAALEKAGHTKHRTNQGVRVVGLRLKTEFEL